MLNSRPPTWLTSFIGRGPLPLTLLPHQTPKSLPR